jgi:tight adherence protein C
MSAETLLVLGVVLIFVAILVVVGSLALGAGEPQGVARSLAIIERQITHSEVGKNELPAKDRLLMPVLDRSRRLGLAFSPKGTTERLTRMLNVAGNPAEWPAERVLGAKGIGMLVGALFGLLLGGISLTGLLFVLAGGAIGLFLPDLLVYNAGLKRQDRLRTGLADALDMLTVCMEAGQSFDGALLQVARSVEGPIAGEFARVLSEVQIGRSRGEAFRQMGERTTPPEVKTFVSAIVQADRLGLPIANVLREQAKEMRLVRKQRAEEKAQKVPVKILFPMLFCIFPALLVVVIGPGIVRIMSMFGSMGG